MASAVNIKTLSGFAALAHTYTYSKIRSGSIKVRFYNHTSSFILNRRVSFSHLDTFNDYSLLNIASRLCRIRQSYNNRLTLSGPFVLE